ncbi:response regulator transcription factor [Cohnella ginsengisoli]|uniref:Response regulator transcription factor n=1 Tax=Cohnella ginsengisoli TaxID=425004 RepID=A0A9X4KJ64_9BACL|nr:response regulator transcription factor [Cohnella ginsengisoli]MDG0791162.1 response regulator transcription factor [Cohnella ginsengisoli]
MIRVVIADDQTLMRDGLQTIIDLQKDMEVVGAAEDGIQACELVRELRPDLVLMDIRMPRRDGIESTKTIKREHPETAVLILTTFAEDEYIVDALANGACGYMLKDLPALKIVESIRDAVKGQLMLPASVAAKLASRLAFLTKAPADVLDPNRLRQEMIRFTDREKKVILLMLEGRSNREMAEFLFMSEGTVKNYVSVIYQKIGTNDRAKALLLLQGLMREGEPKDPSAD